jgi:uncharacterized protein Veg
MRKLLYLFIVSAVFSACQKNENIYIIKNKQVGKLTDTTTIAGMKKLYQNDSIVKNTKGQSAFEPYDEYVIYDKKSKKALLTVIPKIMNDENSLIKRVEINSPLFKTGKKVGLDSDFGSFKTNHKIGRIDETFKYIVVFIDDLNATIDMNKDVLPLNARNDSSIKIDKTLIPDHSKIKHFVVFFNE